MTLRPDRPFVLIIWDDAHADLDQYKPSEWQSHKPDPIHTHGYLIRSDEAGVSVAWEWLPPDDYRTFTFIPRGMVREERRLVVINPRKPKKEVLK